MEVHHHPHVEKKSFKEYFLEFLMIFLAVTMGFIAENIREGIVQKETERTYIESFYKDISSDEEQLSRSIEEQENHIKCADSLIILLESPNTSNPANRIYYYAKNIVRQRPIGFDITERTITQLKNSGGFRLIQNQQLSDSIIDYYKMVEEIKFLQEWLQRYQQTLEENYTAILWGSHYNMTIDSTDKIIMPAEKLYLKTANRDATDNCILRVSDVKGLIATIKQETQILAVRAANLKQFIENTYHFENK